MRNATKALFVTVVLLAEVAATSTLLAQESSGKHGPMMSMMGGSMTDQCNQMMSTGRKPNDQWRKDRPDGRG